MIGIHAAPGSAVTKVSPVQRRARRAPSLRRLRTPSTGAASATMNVERGLIVALGMGGVVLALGLAHPSVIGHDDALYAASCTRDAAPSARGARAGAVPNRVRRGRAATLPLRAWARSWTASESRSFVIDPLGQDGESEHAQQTMNRLVSSPSLRRLRGPRDRRRPPARVPTRPFDRYSSDEQHRQPRPTR
jgi:hypothetical protein